MSGVNSSGCNTATGRGLQVVHVCPRGAPQRYELDEAALQSVLLRPEVRDLPVVLVSVAGAYRRGKSFLLDFFLRYLYAPRSSQLSGEWLGQEDEVLTGFHWRGGGERDTTGIHLWSEPIVTTIEQTGQKVAVLLMDTQGTFDTESTLCDNSTIFALSTLVSSVQIYNLFGNICEDDLQHLQLFTEYGRLASQNGEGKAFQTLQFLVRDWMHGFEHRHGYEGGEELLNKRLQIQPDQPQELRQVREHIRSCFDNIKCFLMPHPGLAVADANFAGCLRDIMEKFRIALLELVPALLDPRNLTPKMVNGNRVTARDLLYYFQTYIRIYNSEEMPVPKTIYQATLEASMHAAVRAARELYEARMGRALGAELSMTASALQACHAAACTDALDAFAAQKKLGSTDDADHYLEELKRELESCVSLFMWNNESRIREGLAGAHKMYEDMLAAASGDIVRVCLDPRQLELLHTRALDKALTHFKSTRHDSSEDDEHKENLTKSLKEKYESACTMNENNNKSAWVEAREQYISRMRALCSDAGVSTGTLRAQHEAARRAALEHLAARRSGTDLPPCDCDGDVYRQQLLQEIETCFLDFEKRNINSNAMMMQSAEYHYHNNMTMEWGPPLCCFHPTALEKLHKNVMKEVLAQFLTNREESETAEFKTALTEVLKRRYEQFQSTNNYNNEQAVTAAFTEYCRRMDKDCKPSFTSILVVPFIVKVLVGLPAFHLRAERHAKSTFNDRRRGEIYSGDEYKQMLDEKIEEAFSNYRNPLVSFLRELGIPEPH